MIDLIRKITTETKESKIGSLMSLSESYIAFIVDSIFIDLLDYIRKDKKNTTLNNHNQEIKCLKFCKPKTSNESLLLCSCSIDRIVIWNVSEIVNLNIRKGLTLKKNLPAQPTQCIFRSDNAVLAVSYGENLSIFETNTATHVMHVQFKEYLNNIEYLRFDSDLISASYQNDSLVVYDLKNQVIVQTIRNDSFNSIATLENENSIVTTDLNGHLNIYKQEIQSARFTLTKKISLENLYLNRQNKTEKQSGDESHASFLCIGLHMFSLAASSRLEFDETRKNSRILIVCATSACLFFIDFDSGNLIYLIDFNQNSPNKKLQNLAMPQAIDCQIVNDGRIHLAFLLLFQNEINIMKCGDVVVPKIDKPSIEVNKENFDSPILSVFPNMALLADSPLNEKINENEKVFKKIPSMHEMLKKTSSIKKLANSIDKPLTFNSTIKSSGYRQVAVKREKFTPLINKTQRSFSVSSLQNTDAVRKPSAQKPEFQFELPTTLDKKFNISDRPNAVTLMKYSDDGQNLAVATADNIIQYLTATNLEKPGLVFNGHAEIVRSIDLSHDCKYLFSTSDDKTCKLWSLKKPTDPLIDIRSIKISESQNYTLKKEVVAGCFFYVDKFVLIGTENKFLLCKYYVDSKKHDVQRYLNGTYCKLVKQIELTSAPSITAISTINSFYSYLVITGGSDKSIEVFDMNQVKSCLTIPEAHAKSFHQICQNGSEFNHSYDLFLTCAVGDGIKLWDLRSAQCVNHLDYHMNRCLPMKASFSTDSYYVAAGSEDRSAFVYDLRMNGTIQKFGTFSDTVSNAQFNPKKSQFVCATQDGKLYSYKLK